jgi:hypothetical protein
MIDIVAAAVAALVPGAAMLGRGTWKERGDHAQLE